MKHRKNKLLELSTWIVKKNVFIKTLLSNLIKSWKVTTTPKRAKVLKSHADYFFSRLIKITGQYEEKDAKRECIRFIKENIDWEETGKMVLNTRLPKYKESWNQSSFVADYKMWYRVWDWAPKIMLKLL